MSRSILSLARVSFQVFLTIALFFAVLLIAPVADVALAQTTPPLDHFRCYPLVLGPQPEVSSVLLQDQFDLALGLQLPGTSLCPLLSRVNPIASATRCRNRPTARHCSDNDHRRPRCSLHALRDLPRDGGGSGAARDPAVTWRVRVRNQFGEQRLDARRPVASRCRRRSTKATEFPDDLDHFKCYDARGRSVRRRALLEDQFETETVAVLEPRLFCNPTRKQLTTGEHPRHSRRRPSGLLRPGHRHRCVRHRRAAPRSRDLEPVHRLVNRGHRRSDPRGLLCVPSRKLGSRRCGPVATTTTMMTMMMMMTMR